MELKSLSLEKLNSLAEKKRFALEDLNFVESPRAQFWAPPTMSPLYYLKSFQRLTPKQQLRYNQLFSMGVCEQFIWFEGDLIAKILPKVASKTRDPELKKSILYFLEDEEKHTEMFWLLLENQEASMYPTRKFALLNLKFSQKIILRWMTAFPSLNLVWIWMAIFFEERTMDYSQQYMGSSGHVGGLNANFIQTHKLHLQDEARHFQMDLYFLKAFYDPQPAWKKWWAQFLMYRLMKAYTSPKRVSLKILQRMQREFTDLSDDVVEQLKLELRDIRDNKGFLEMAFGEKAVPRSRELMRRYPEMKKLLDLF